LLIFGLVSGVGLSLLAQGAAEAALTGTIIVGLVSGLALFLVFLFVRSLLGPTKIEPGDLVRNETISKFAELVVSFGGSGKDTREAKEKVLEETSGFISTGVAVWTAASALAAGVALVGAVFAAIAALAALRQVDRITQQNRLIEEQLYESKATREAQIFSSMLDLVLVSIQETVPALSGTPQTDNAGIDSGSDRASDVRVPQDVVARINAVLTSFSPYQLSPRGEDRLFSPEKARVFVAMRSAGFPFGALKEGQRLDFSKSQFADLNLTGSQLGLIDLSDSDLGRTDLSSADLKGAVLEQAILPPPGLMGGAKLKGVNVLRASVETGDWLFELGQSTAPMADVGFSERCWPEINVEYPEFDFEFWRVSPATTGDGGSRAPVFELLRNDYAVEIVKVIEERIEQEDIGDGIIDPEDVPFEELADLSKRVQPEAFGDPRQYSNPEHLGGHPSLHERAALRNRSRRRILEFFARDAEVDDIKAYIAHGGSFQGALVEDGKGVLHMPDAANANFDQAALSGVDFSRTVLAGASFREAILPSADRFSGADLTSVDLEGAYVDDRWLSDMADLDQPPIGFDPETWRLAHYQGVPIKREADCTIVDYINLSKLERAE